MKKQIFGLVGAAVLACTSAPFTAQELNAAAEGYTDRGTTPDNTYAYKVWSADGKDDISFDGNEKEYGEFSCKWEDASDCMFAKGIAPQTLKDYKSLGSIVCDYDLSFQAAGYAQFGVEGWLVKGGTAAGGRTLVEFYIVDGYTEWNPAEGMESVGKVKIDGCIYEMFRETVSSFDSPDLTLKYMSVIAEKQNPVGKEGAASCKKKISVSEHLKAWEQAGLDVSGKVDCVFFEVDGWQSSGEAEIRKNQIRFNSSEPVAPESGVDYADNGVSKDGRYSYEVWNARNVGDVSFKGNENGGGFTFNWDQTHDTMVSMGMQLRQNKSYEHYQGLRCDYAMEYEAKGVSFYGVHGWFTDCEGEYPLAEYYIVDGWHEWRPTPQNGNARTVMINGRAYRIFRTLKTDAPSILGEQTYYQYWSVAENKQVPDVSAQKGAIDIFIHFQEWSKEEWDMSGNLRDASFFVSAFNSSGKVNVTKNNVSMWGYGDQPDIAQPDDDADQPVDYGDLEILKDYLMTGRTDYADWKNADLNGDGLLNAADLTMLKQYLLAQA